MRIARLPGLISLADEFFLAPRQNARMLSSSFPHFHISDTGRKEWLLVLGLVVAIKTGWLVADHTLRLYMGDSMVYLQTGAWLSGSPGRSFLYGALLHFSVFPLRSPLAIVVFQAFLSALTALGLFYFLRHVLNLRFWISALATACLATEPSQIFFERMVMAETAGQLALVAMLIALSRFLVQGGLRWYLASCLLGLAAANFRTSLLPAVLGLGLCAPLIKYWLLDTGKSWKFRLKPLALAMAILAGSHVAYTQAYGYAFKCPPGYLALTGMMRIGLVAPLIRPEHFEGTGVSGEVLKQVKLPLADHWQRGNHIWSSDGLWRVLEANSTQPELVARTITRRAMLGAPLDLLRINLETLGGYFSPHRVYWRMQDDIGAVAPDERALQLLDEWLDWNARGVNALETPARRYFAASYHWQIFCLFALVPIALLMFCLGWFRPQRSQYVLLALASIGLVTSHLLFAHIVSFRYLHPLPWFVIANLAILANMALSLRRGSLPSPQVANADMPMP